MKFDKLYEAYIGPEYDAPALPDNEDQEEWDLIDNYLKTVYRNKQKDYDNWTYEGGNVKIYLNDELIDEIPMDEVRTNAFKVGDIVKLYYGKGPMKKAEVIDTNATKKGYFETENGMLVKILGSEYNKIPGAGDEVFVPYGLGFSLLKVR